MSRFCLTLVVIFLGYLSAQSQEQMPYFNLQSDSATYFSSEAKLWELYRNPKDHGSAIDSLNRVLFEMRRKIAGFRYVYKPRYRTIDQINKQDFARIKELSLKNVSKIPKEVYAMSQLQSLELISTSIKRVPRKLNRLTDLKNLTIRNNNSGFRLTRNKTITSLTLGSVQLPKKYSKFKKLESLDLSKNNLTSFPNIVGLNQLKSLNLKNNKIKSIDGSFRSTPLLETLELQYNEIENVSSSISQLPELKKLMLSYNKVTSIDDALTKCTKLEQLGLYQNKLKTIPNALYQLSALKEVDLYYNEIEPIDARIANWKNLKILYLSNNRIFSLPESIGELTQLEELYLSNNRLADLPQKLSELQDLRVLRVNDNRLIQIPKYLLKLNNLENIDISNNGITALDLALLERPQLKILVLMDNPWEPDTKMKLFNKAEELRAKGITVHLEGPSGGGPAGGKKP